VFPNISPSRGSPISSPSTKVSEWQQPMASLSKLDLKVVSWSYEAALSSLIEEANSVNFGSVESLVEPVADLTPRISMPSSVRVPVLSKTMIYIIPLTLTRGGEMQKIWHFLSRWMAKATPAVMVAGRAGGTVTVRRSRDLSISFSVVVPILISFGRARAKPPRATKAMRPTKIRASR